MGPGGEGGEELPFQAVEPEPAPSPYHNFGRNSPRPPIKTNNRESARTDWKEQYHPQAEPLILLIQSDGDVCWRRCVRRLIFRMRSRACVCVCVVSAEIELEVTSAPSVFSPRACASSDLLLPWLPFLPPTTRNSRPTQWIGRRWCRHQQRDGQRSRDDDHSPGRGHRQLFEPWPRHARGDGVRPHAEGSGALCPRWRRRRRSRRRQVW